MLDVEPSSHIQIMKDMGNTVQWSLKDRDLSLYCKFHDDVAHSTDQCVTLYFEIINLLKKGFLADLLTRKVEKPGKIEANTLKPMEVEEGAEMSHPERAEVLKEAGVEELREVREDKAKVSLNKTKAVA